MSIIEELESLKKECGAEVVKVYYQDEDNYCIKVIKDEKIIRRIRKGHITFDNPLSQARRKDLGK